MAESKSWRDRVFQYRGAILAVPALVLVVVGRPSRRAASIGVPLALLGEALRCWAVGYSGKTTRADVVVAPSLATGGPYAYVRNPLYVGNFVTAVGLAWAFTGALRPRRRFTLVGGSLATMIAVYATIVPLEEAYLAETFGEAYERYCAAVPAVIPLVTRWRGASGTYDPSVIAGAESRTFVWLAALLSIVIARSVR